MRVSTTPQRHRVVVIGGGFGGLQAVRKLRSADVEITLIARRSFHLFQPLVYQVATGSLSAEEVASPLRSIFKKSKNVHVMLAQVTGLDLENRHVLVDQMPNGDGSREIPYDTLIVAAGMTYTYFGHDDWRPFAPDIKSVTPVVTAQSVTAVHGSASETPGQVLGTTPSYGEAKKAAVTPDTVTVLAAATSFEL